MFTGNPEIAREYEKYMRYINNSKNRHYGTGTPRSKSARSYRGSSGRGSPSKSDRSETRYLYCNVHYNGCFLIVIKSVLVVIVWIVEVQCQHSNE